MNNLSLRSSGSSYRDPRYFSSASFEPAPPPSKVLVDGYRGVLDSIQDEGPGYNALNSSNTRGSALLNSSDPVVMHLLAETALSDSMQLEVLSFEEVEGLKKELSLLSNRIDSIKRKLALEMKLREAAQSLGRLNGSGIGENGGLNHEGSANSHQRHPNSSGQGTDTQDGADSELATSTRKCEELAQELWQLERQASEARRRLLEHTAGVLQMTHKGLKKKNSTKNVDGVNGDHRPSGADYFDDRSLYKTADYLDDFNGPPGGRSAPNTEQLSLDMNAIQATTTKLEELNRRLREMVLQAKPNDDFDPIPHQTANGAPANSIGAIQAHLEYLEKGLESVASHQSHPTLEPANSDHETEERLEELNQQLDDILVNVGARQKLSPHTSTARKMVPQQLSALGTAISDIQKRADGLVEQKTILTTQIQQQRDLNNKSDAERDAHSADLSNQITELRKDLETSREDAESTKEELTVTIDQLDSTRQQLMLHEQQRTADDATTVSREEFIAKEDEIRSLEATIEQLRSEQEQNSGKAAADEEINRLQSEYSELESEMVRIQTELTLAKAELDGAYGSRAERAAEAAANPALQKEMEDLSQRNITLTEELASIKANQGNNNNSATQQRVHTLETELREVIDDYEALTKSSIEFEKERDKLEAMIDKYRDRCEDLEAQVNDQKIQGLDSSVASSTNRDVPPENTSTMVLKKEFKKIMRDTRTENIKALKAEQEERRKLEALVRTLKKEQTTSKTNLSQSTLAS